jgi:hypothetical protein
MAVFPPAGKPVTQRWTLGLFHEASQVQDHWRRPSMPNQLVDEGESYTA